MLSHYFRDPGTLLRVRACLSAPHLEGYAEAMLAEGYAKETIRTHLRTAVHLGAWAGRERVPFFRFDEAVIERFRRHLPACECPGPRPRRCRSAFIAASARRFLSHLRKTGVAPSPKPEPESASSESALLVGFRAWMLSHRGARPATLSSYGRIIADAIGSELGEDTDHYDVAGLRAFVLDRSRRHGRSKAKLIATAMRMFLRYLVAAGKCKPGIDGAIPKIARWRLSALPRYLTPSEVVRVIEACDSMTPIDLRDRAILILLSRLGLRAGDASALAFSDIDWSQGTIRLDGKGRHSTRLPLPQDVGDAILAYMHKGRPQFPTDRIFLRGKAPWGPVTNTAVSALVRRRIRAAGVVTPCQGAHVLRHSAAFGMLRDGASLEQIRAVLRHRDPETTMHYAKVDIEMLRQVAQPWPEVTP